MTEDIVALARRATYDFRATAHPDDPFQNLFEQWVTTYRVKWAVSAYLKPQRILEIGVRFGYSAQAFLDATPSAYYLGLDIDSPSFGGHLGAIYWAQKALAGRHVDLCIIDSQILDQFPGGVYDLIHIDGQQDGVGTLHDLERALKQARWILVDGYFWSRENFLWASEFLLQNRDAIEQYIVLPGFSGDLLIQTRMDAARGPRPESYYYLHDCTGYDSWHRTPGKRLEGRLQALADLALCRPHVRALILGNGAGDLQPVLAAAGFQVTMADGSAASLAALTGEYQVIAATRLVERLTEKEREALYDWVGHHLTPEGAFLLHTYPNRWFYRYEHARRIRIARSIGAYLPADPRTPFERSMPIDEQSPRLLRRELRRHFPEVLLWFASDLSAPFENLRRRFSHAEMRAAGDLFAIASRRPVDPQQLLPHITMVPMEASEAAGVQIEVLDCPDRAGRRTTFGARVRILNGSPKRLRSCGPNPVHLSYHWLDSETGAPVFFDGRRTMLEPEVPAQSRRDFTAEVETISTPGRYTLRLTLVQEGVRWFDDLPMRIYADRIVEVAESSRLVP